MSRKLLCWLIPVVAVLSLGMGDFGPSESIPPWPARNFTGTVTDRTLVSLPVTNINCEGKTAIKAHLGEMQISLPFDNIAEIEFAPGTADKVWGQVKMRNGTSEKMRFHGTTRCYAKSDLGPVTVKIQNLKNIRLNAPPPP